MGFGFRGAGLYGLGTISVLLLSVVLHSSGCAHLSFNAQVNPSRDFVVKDVGGCQNYGPFLGTPNNRCHVIIGTQNSTIILTTTHVHEAFSRCCCTQGFEVLGF